MKRLPAKESMTDEQLLAALREEWLRSARKWADSLDKAARELLLTPPGKPADIK